MSELYREAQDLVNQTQELQRKRKECAEKLSSKIASSFSEVCTETRRHFNLEGLVEIEVQTKFLSAEAQCHLAEFQKLKLLFEVNGTTYEVQFLTSYTLRIQKFGTNWLQIEVERTSKGCCKISQHERCELEKLKEHISDVSFIAEMLRDRSFDIERFVHRNLNEYALTDRLHLKQSVRLMLWAHKNKSGDFSVLPRDVLVLICKVALAMTKFIV